MIRVSVITPTFRRPQWLRMAQKCFQSQDHLNIEWLILDDSESPDHEFRMGLPPNAKYFYSATRLSVGQKRNLLVERSQGDVIVHFDDDDYYAPGYVSFMVNALQQGKLDLINLRSFFLYHASSNRFAYWDLTLKLGLHFEMSPERIRMIEFKPENNALLADNHYGFGFGYAYRREVWESVKFPDLNFAEDGVFALNARNGFNVSGVIDKAALALHVVHNGNTSISFPQYLLPRPVALHLFGEANVQGYLSP